MLDGLEDASSEMEEAKVGYALHMIILSLQDYNAHLWSISIEMKIIILKVMDLSVSWLILGFPHHESFFLLTIYYHPCLIDVWQDLFNYTDIYALFVVSKDQLNLHWNSFIPTSRFCIGSSFWKHSLYAPSTNFNMRKTSFEKLYYVWCSNQFKLKTNEIFDDTNKFSTWGQET